MTPPLALQIYAFLTFPLSRQGSLVWWWRMHVNGHQNEPGVGCPYCERDAAQWRRTKQ